MLLVVENIKTCKALALPSTAAQQGQPFNESKCGHSVKKQQSTASKDAPQGHIRSRGRCGLYRFMCNPISLGSAIPIAGIPVNDVRKEMLDQDSYKQPSGLRGTNTCPSKIHLASLWPPSRGKALGPLGDWALGN